MHFRRRYNESSFKCKVIPWITAKKVWNKLAAWQLFLNLYQTGLVFLLRHYKRPFIKSTDYLFQLVSVTVSTCSKKERNKRKQLPLGGKSLSIGTTFPIKFVSTNFSEGFQFLLGVMSFFCKNWPPHNFNNGYH